MGIVSLLKRNRKEGLIPLCFWQPSIKTHGFTVNFGDSLFDLICERVVGRHVKVVGISYSGPKLLLGGSVLQACRDGDIIWGVGLRDPAMPMPFRKLDVRAVRGPLTRAFLASSKGIHCPEVYGDPALLLPRLFPEWIWQPERNKVGFIPHYRDIAFVKDVPPGIDVILPTSPPRTVVDRILRCEYIVSSSLHGLIVAEAFGIPSRWVRLTELEPIWKFYDYYLSTNRAPSFARTLQEALDLGGQKGIAEFDGDELLRTFPTDVDYWFENNGATSGHNV